MEMYKMDEASIHWKFNALQWLAVHFGSETNVRIKRNKTNDINTPEQHNAENKHGSNKLSVCANLLYLMV